MDTPQALHDRLKWLQQKEAAMREVGGPDYTPSQLLRGRVQGQIGEVKRALESLRPSQQSKGVSKS